MAWSPQTLQASISISGTSRPRWWCHLLQSWLVWGAPCLLCCPAAPSAPPSALSLEHPEWKVAKETRAKNEFAKKYYLPELVATTVEHSWSWPCGDTLNNIQYNGNPLQSLSILTRLFLCLETGSDDPVKRYELIIEIDCSILKLDCSIGWSLGNISDKNDPKKLRCDAGKLELL